jgi:lipopolysaccharide/colanic/teichoic acid biosynthesis glycosyltransferase
MILSSPMAVPAGELPVRSGLEVSPWAVSSAKRCFDFAFGSLALFTALPLFAVIALAIKCTSSGPVLFRQMRVGQHGLQFELLKFRTMRNQPGSAITRKGDSRITSVGRFLRRMKLDELPQLINVVRGEMSLVGPRPDLPQFWLTVAAGHSAIMQLRPGLTGRASLLFRDEESLLASVPENRLNEYYVSKLLPIKVGKDLEYAERSTLLSDLGTILRTLLLYV